MTKYSHFRDEWKKENEYINIEIVSNEKKRRRDNFDFEQNIEELKKKI
jgi:hypothetical protein